MWLEHGLRLPGVEHGQSRQHLSCQMPAPIVPIFVTTTCFPLEFRRRVLKARVLMSSAAFSLPHLMHLESVSKVKGANFVRYVGSTKLLAYCTPFQKLFS